MYMLSMGSVGFSDYFDMIISQQLQNTKPRFSEMSELSEAGVNVSVICGLLLMRFFLYSGSQF